jgi:hypothetical protein
MEGWSKLQSSLGSINFASAGTKITKGFNSSVQATRERLGQVAQDEITELPQGALLFFRVHFFSSCILVCGVFVVGLIWGESGRKRESWRRDDKLLIEYSYGD